MFTYKTTFSNSTSSSNFARGDYTHAWQVTGFDDEGDLIILGRGFATSAKAATSRAQSEINFSGYGSKEVITVTAFSSAK